MASARRSAPLLARIGLALASVLLVLVVAEVALRIAWQPTAISKPRPIPQEWADLPKLKHGGMSALNKPGARGTAAGALIEMNSDGLRGPSRPRRKPPGVYRIALIGDSFTMGWGVLYEETYGALVEERLNRAPGGRRHEVINAGLSGYNTEAVVKRFHYRALGFDPDLIVYGFTLNDIEGDHYEKLSRWGYENPHRYERTPFFLWRFVGPRLEALRDSLWPADDSYTRELLYNYFENAEAWAALEAGLDNLRKRAEQQDACVVILLHTQLTSLSIMHPFHPIYDRVAEAAEARGFQVARSYEQHAGRNERELWVLDFDHHPNATGHRLLADALMDGLTSLPQQCW
jgi:lysophospholipase L1-like esterase